MVRIFFGVSTLVVLLFRLWIYRMVDSTNDERRVKLKPSTKLNATTGTIFNSPCKYLIASTVDTHKHCRIQRNESWTASKPQCYANRLLTRGFLLAIGRPTRSDGHRARHGAAGNLHPHAPHQHRLHKCTHDTPSDHPPPNPSRWQLHIRDISPFPVTPSCSP